VEDRGGQNGRSGRPRVSKKVLLYAGIALVPVMLFCLMLLLAKR
jgi:hypothetical protein